MDFALMAPLLAQFEQAIKALEVAAPLSPASHTRTLFIGYSGGMDSELLAATAAAFMQHQGCDVTEERVRYRVCLVHVHHGLSQHADTWVKHCSQRAALYQLPLTVCRVNLDNRAGKSLEAVARDARYQALDDLMAAGDVLLTAHHQDDQLETVLLALARGFGPLGLSAMGAVQAFGAHKWQCRPFLALSRDELEEFAALFAITHIDDESNQDTRFDRNFLRHEIIPKLKQRWPAIARTASRSASLCANEYELLTEEVDVRLQRLEQYSAINGMSLCVSGLAQLSPDWQTQVLRRFIQRRQCPMPSQVQLQQVLMQIHSAKEDAKVSLHVSGCLLRRFGDGLYVATASVSDKARFEVIRQAIVTTLGQTLGQGKEALDLQLLSSQALNSQSQSEPCLRLAYPSVQLEWRLAREGARLRLPHQDEVVSVGYWGDKDISGRLRCHPSFRHQGRELKKMWQELAVAPWIREQVPLVFYNQTLVASGLWVERHALAQDQGAGWLACVTPG
ncbi:tRNA lysidine(34) synthetase TilS [Shewanella sp. SNU WT4]|uniref:tRNA lysidine(34) synthetase TilS n=1 Tax=Shewanella sp. SNU WT4 TaxID=2590015 RepID=UPI00112ECD6C|nr:tRNA lysidine(34) synthetase TilS [Shewanella sp. SNU WT4]QDF67755.1 tRNA lysidine(34) synthetase TilS [Shewanella sp. SNU WT4]